MARWTGTDTCNGAGIQNATCGFGLEVVLVGVIAANLIWGNASFAAFCSVQLVQAVLVFTNWEQKPFHYVIVACSAAGGILLLSLILMQAVLGS